MVYQMCDIIMRMSAVIKDFEQKETGGLEAAGASVGFKSAYTHLGVLDGLYQTLLNTRRMYITYQEGWTATLFAVTPHQVAEKAMVQKQKLIDGFQALSMAIHQTKISGIDFEPAATFGTSRRLDLQETWEVIEGDMDFAIDAGTNMPRQRLGSWGCVGEGTYKGRPVAIKMAPQSQVRAAMNRPELLRDFCREVHAVCSLEHPNVCTCYGSLTFNAAGRVCLWMVMEKLQMNLHEAIHGDLMMNRLDLGRDDPVQFVDLVRGLFSALAYLHASVHGAAMLHGGLKPSSVMLDAGHVPKLVLDSSLLQSSRSWHVADTSMAGPSTALLVAGVNGKEKLALERETTEVMRQRVDEAKLWGEDEWLAPEQVQLAVCSTKSDVFSAALLSVFLWNGLTPRQSSVTAFGDEVLSEMNSAQGALTDRPAGQAMRIIRDCLHQYPHYRPPAATVCRELAACRPAS